MDKGIDNKLSDADLETALNTLGRVEAPLNFEAMVRSRITEGRADSPQAGWMLGLKFALPTIALLLLGAFFLFPGGSGLNERAVMPVNAQTETGADSRIFPDAPGPVTEATKGKEALSARAANGQQNSNLSLTGSKPLSVGEPGGGSRDEAIGQPAPTIYPKGIDPSKRIGPQSIKPPTGNGIPAETVLAMLGIRSECKENGCEAAAIAKQSIAETAGVKLNDLIEAIDEKPVKAGTVFEGTLSVKRLRVLRGGKRITIALNTKQG